MSNHDTESDEILETVFYKEDGMFTPLTEKLKAKLEAWGKKQIVRELAMIEPMASHQLAATVSDRIAELTEGDK